MTEETIFTAALKQMDPVQRQAYLDDACAGNPALRQEIESLLKAHEQPNDFLARPAAEQLATGAFPATAHTEALFPAAPAENLEQTQADQPLADETDLAFLSPSQKPGSLGRLGHYEVLEVLGQGGFGIVVKAFDDKLHRVVAIKIMSLQMAATSPARKRFLREARASAAIRHENVVAIYAVEEQPIPHLVMEYIAGQTLQQKLDQTGPLDLAMVLRLGQQMAGGLAAAHAQGLIHRDIKPSNILLEEGVELRVKITDFGLARAADDASLTQSGVIAGTPMYMSPEQANGEHIDHRADLFSLGSVLYVMCSGRPPFRATSTLGVLKRVAEDTPRPIREIIPEVPDWLCAIVTQLHAKKPAVRIQSAKEVAELLGKCLAEWQAHGRVTAAPIQQKSVAAKPPPTVVAYPSSRRRWLVAGLAIGVLASIVLAGVLQPFWPRADRDKQLAVNHLKEITLPQAGDPFVVVGNQGESEKAFATLKDAVEKAASGDTIEIRGDGPFTTATVTINHPLTIRAGEGFRPVFKREPLDWGQPPLLKAEAALVLEGLELQDLDANPQPGHRRILVQSSSAPLLVTNCRFISSLGIVRAYRSPRVEFRNCELISGWNMASALDWSDPPTKGALRMQNCVTPNWALFLNLSQPELSDVEIEFTGNTFAQRYLLSCYSGGELLGDGKNPRPFRVKATNNVLHNYQMFRIEMNQGRANLADWPLARVEKLAQALLDYQGDRNVYSATASGYELWYGTDKGTAQNIAKPRSEWKQIWGANDANAVEGEIRFKEGDPAQRAFTTPQLLTVADFRLADGSAGKSAGPGGKDAGADLDLVGPGAAYERWKKSSRYEEWHKKTEELMVKGVDEAWLKQVAAMPAEKQVDAVAAKLKELNPGFDGQFTHKIEEGVVTELHIVTDKVTNISPIRVFNGLRVLDLKGTATADWRGNGQLADLTPLKGMNLVGLMELNLEWTKVGDAGLENFKDSKNLTYLGLGATQVSDAGLSYFNGFKNLTHLTLNGTKVSNTGLAYFKDCKSLTVLSVSLSRVNDVGLAHFRDCKNLTHLWLAYTQVSDAGLANFKDCKALTLLDLRHSEVTAPKIEELKKALPECKIEWDGVDDAWVKQVAAMPAEQQVDAVAAKLKELNPGFDGTFTHKIEDGVVTELHIVTDKVTNISPIRVFNGLRALDLRGTPTADWRAGNGKLADLTPLEGMNLAGLKELWLGWTKVDDAGLTYFKDCKNLYWLLLDGTRVTDEGLVHFKDCKNLVWLSIPFTRVGDLGLAYFKDRENMNNLNLTGSQVSDTGLANFKNCKNLKWLHLGNTQVSDAGLAHFKDCKSLESLALNGTQVKDAGLVHFKDCKHLKELWLANTQVSDEGLAPFKDCKELTRLDLRKTKVTAAMVEELKKALPECKIEWDDK